MSKGLIQAHFIGFHDLQQPETEVVVVECLEARFYLGLNHFQSNLELTESMDEV